MESSDSCSSCCGCWRDKKVNFKTTVCRVSSGILMLEHVGHLLAMGAAEALTIYYEALILLDKTAQPPKVHKVTLQKLNK